MKYKTWNENKHNQRSGRVRSFESRTGAGAVERLAQHLYSPAEWNGHRQRDKFLFDARKISTANMRREFRWKRRSGTGRQMRTIKSKKLSALHKEFYF